MGSRRYCRPLSRPGFLQRAGTATVAVLLPCRCRVAAGVRAGSQSGLPAFDTLAWEYLMHFGTRLWWDRETPVWREYSPSGVLRCDPDPWRESVERGASCGVNMMVADLLEGVRYRSHPELAIDGFWSTGRLRATGTAGDSLSPPFTARRG